MLWAIQQHPLNIPSESGLWLGLVPGTPLDDAPPGLTAWQPHRGQALDLKEVRLKGGPSPAKGPYSWVFVSGCPCWPELLWRLGKALRLVHPGGMVVVGLAREQGGDRLTKLPGSVWQESKKKSKVVSFDVAAIPTEQVEEWLAPGELHRSASTGYFTRAGLFGWDKVDAGSRLLLQHLPARLPGRVADFGSGYGYLAHGLADRGWHELHLIEVDQRGLEAAQANLPSLENVHCHWLDLTRENPPGELDHVVMNPPFHRDARIARNLGLSIVEKAAKSLGRGGNLWMVANQSLDYEKLLAQCFTSHKKLAQQDGFKVLWAQR